MSNNTILALTNILVFYQFPKNDYSCSKSISVLNETRTFIKTHVKTVPL